jgi:hypothetical protein
LKQQMPELLPSWEEQWPLAVFIVTTPGSGKKAGNVGESYAPA